MLETLRSRGPDDGGEHLEPGVALGMRRLIVIDPHGGRQPFIDSDTGVVVVYNGELYNFRNLRRELEAKGMLFVTASDTEVLLKAYVAYGDSFVEKLNGMFAFALWDPRTRRLLLGRDHLGQKPLHVWQAGSTLVFGSEVRTLLPFPDIKLEIDETGLASYLRHRHVPGPGTIIKGVRQVPPATLMVRDASGKVSERRFWSPEFKPDARMDLAGAAEGFTACWRRAIARHLISDVPVGAFLSGGIDSGLVVAEMIQQKGRANTFSIAFENKALDETRYAQEVSRLLGSDHTVFRFEQSFAGFLESYARAFDQPFADPAAFPTLQLAREARRQVTVVLTGDGGDELFAGYQRYRSALLSRRVAKVPGVLRRTAAGALGLAARTLPAGANQRMWLDAVARRLRLVKNDWKAEYVQQFWTFDEKELAAVLDIEPSKPSPDSKLEGAGSFLCRLLKYDLMTWLPDQMLPKVDRATMASSLEARTPFLDREVVEFALTVPPEINLTKYHLKSVLREAARGVLPETLCRRRKHGFAVPVDAWLRDERETVASILDHGLRRHTEFHAPSVRQLWHAHVHGRRNYGEKLLCLVVFFFWHEELHQLMRSIGSR